MPPVNRCSAKRPRWPHVQCTGHGWPGAHSDGHRWWFLFFWWGRA